MKEEEIKPTVAQFIRKNFIFNENQHIDERSSLIGSGIIDSTGVLELILFLETTFNIRFKDEELTAENFDSIEAIKACLLTKMHNNEK